MNSRSFLIFIICLLLCFSIFFIDLFSNYHLVEGVCYPPILLFTILTDKINFTYIIAFLSVFFIGFEFFYTGDKLLTDETGMRVISILAMGFTTYIITKYRDTESKVKKQSENLELLNAKLKESNTELENFAFISSHDLQEPLRKIQAFGDRLTMSDGNVISEKGMDYLSRMLNAAGRMQILINDLLYFSRQTSVIPNFISIDLNSILIEVMTDLEFRIESTNTVINAEELPTIEAGAIQMRQLFQNLLSNAIKFRKENESPAIKIYSKIVPDKKDNKKQMAEIYFADNGIGFEEKFNDRIYNIFQKLEGKKYKGSGIGLSICKKIVERHNGTIYAKSEINKGSIFLVTLPIKQ
ncbi:MAG: hypothetical protein A3F72_05185 [Bacteroidetes bacterium RIFCSPLOWO2_12_FULL_35_15]|nr:MAG: hypothetical protein A3F72_05185 [Bacteroidetes bacterium RIFCSPLOWO2_12_FULL_35_15]